MKKVIILFVLVFLLTACTQTNTSKTQTSISNPEGNKQSILQVDEEGNTKVDKTVLSNILNQASAAELTEEEMEGIKFMLEEEKLARDVYIKLFEKWDQKNFQNISQSEGTHIDAIKTLAEKYGVDINFYNDEVGKYTNAELAKLFTDLVAQGDVSLIEALKVGALIEEIDIVDLDKYLNSTSNTDLELVYENLKRGSRNHLRSFVRTMTRQGQNYEPKRLGQEKYDEIVSSENERGGSGQNEGQGNKNGGRGQGGNKN